MISFLKKKLHKIYTEFTQKLSALFSKSKLDEDFLKELKVLLIKADVGVLTTSVIIDHLRKEMRVGRVATMPQARDTLKEILSNQLTCSAPELYPEVLLLVGINGSGKTTFASKLAKKLKDQGKKVLLVAADTFRAAAIEQLEHWANHVEVDFFSQKGKSDPSSVIFDACRHFLSHNYDHIIIDTAGRLQTKTNLIKELEKVKRVVLKCLPGTNTKTWLTIDTMIGQNSLNQALIFDQATQLDGLILTKFDSTAKGGIVFSITEKLRIPIVYVTFGEGIMDIKPFDNNEYVDQLLEIE